MKIFHSHGNSTFIIIIFILSLIIILPFLSLAIDTIIPTTPLTINQTIVSNGQVFELGFFNPGNDKLYIGIWYKQIIPKTYVWVANRDTPITSLLGVLSVVEKGNILLLDHAESVVSAWSSNVSFPEGNSTRNTVAQLLDSGNFVLRWENDENPENYIWQSFDHPTDTLLPKMKLGWDKKTGVNRFLQSWKTTTDPGMGDYSFKMNIDGLPELFILNNEAKSSRSGSWNGKRFSGVPEMKGEKIMNFEFWDNSDEIYYSFEMINTSVYSRLIIDYAGIMRRFIWVETTKTWSLYWFLPRDLCDYFGECGAFGFCNSNTAPICNCVTGFRTKNQQSWDRRDGKDGCERSSQLNCWSDGFLLMKNMKLPEGSKAFVDQMMNLTECGEICKRNCSCAAYANMDITQNGSGCVIWEVDLMDMRQYTDSEGGQDLYVRVAASDLVQSSTTRGSKNGSDNGNHVVKIVSIPVGVFGVLIILLIAILFYLKRKKTPWVKKSKTDRTGLQEKSEDFLLNGEVNVSSKKDYYGETKLNELDLPLFDFTTLDMATNNFSEANKLGQGGFGCVYKGTLVDGEVVAVKRLSKVSDQGIDELKNEVQLIAKLQHRNLVRLLGCCIEVEEKLLIYEFMENKSLDTFLYEKEERMRLYWQMRLDIICGIARGLLYLHQDSRFKIIHRDMKASNILLDKEMNPKISDFGMARIFGRDQTEAETKKVVGTYGYMSPEYAMDGNFSTKSDVFSFGVLVLEIVSGKKNRGSSYTSSQLNLLGHAWMLFKENNALKLLDESIGDKYSIDEVLRCIQIGLLCVQEQPEDRPSMSKVLLMLSSETIQLPQPNYPGFFIQKRHLEIESSRKEYDSMTINEMTVTQLEAR